MPTSDPVVAGGTVGSSPTVAGGAVSTGPLVQTPHQAGDPFHTAWDAVAPPGTGSPSFIWRQEDPQSVVTIEHGLGFRPGGVSLFSLDYGTKYRGFGVQHLDANTLRISMDAPTACVVVLS